MSRKKGAEKQPSATVYWTNVVAPALRQKKLELGGRKFTHLMIAISIADTTKESISRSQVNHWFTGIREPNIFQFAALCQKMRASPEALLPDPSTVKKRLGILVDQKKLASRKPDKGIGKKSQDGED